MRTGMKIMLWGNLAKDPEYVTIPNSQNVRMKTTVMVNWMDFKGQKQNATLHGSTFLNPERYAKIYPIFEGSKGRPVMVTGDFRPTRGMPAAGKQYADYAWLNIERAEIEALWSRTQVQASVQAQPVATPAAPPPSEWSGAPTPVVPPPAPVHASTQAQAPPPPPPPTA